MIHYLLTIVIFFVLPFHITKDTRDFSEEGEPTKISRTPIWQGKMKMVLKPIISIGCDDIDKENYVFGIISDLAIDHDECIYVLDGYNYRVQKFSHNGRFLASFGKGKGEGPGEFLRPKRIAVDSLKRLYVTDMRQFRITVFDSTGEIIATIPTLTMPYQIGVGQEGQIYITSFLNFEEQRVSKYSLISKRRLLTFCKPRKECRWIAEAGDGENIAIDYKGNVYVGFYYPYDIRVFSAKGALLNRFARQAKFFKPPKRDENGVMNLLSGTWGMAILPDNKLITIVFYCENKDHHFYFDVFDSDGTWLLEVPTDQYGVTWPRIIAADYEGNLYLDHSEPYPHLIKYKLTFEKN